MARNHVITVLSDLRDGNEPAVYVDGVLVGISEGMITSDLRNIQPHIRRGFVIQSGGGTPDEGALTGWPDDLDDVAALQLYGDPL